MPGDVCSLSFFSCSLDAKTVVSALELWTMESCAPGHHRLLEEEETQWKGGGVSGSTLVGGLYSLIQ